MKPLASLLVSLTGLLMTITVQLLGASAASAQPVPGGRMDPAERQRLRGELRQQAQEERMRRDERFNGAPQGVQPGYPGRPGAAQLPQQLPPQIPAQNLRQFGGPQYQQPPQYVQPQYAQPQYAQPQYARPQYQQPRYQQPQYPQQQYQQPPPPQYPHPAGPFPPQGQPPGQLQGQPQGQAYPGGPGANPRLTVEERMQLRRQLREHRQRGRD